MPGFEFLNIPLSLQRANMTRYNGWSSVGQDKVAAIMCLSQLLTGRQMLRIGREEFLQSMGESCWDPNKDTFKMH